MQKFNIQQHCHRRQERARYSTLFRLAFSSHSFYLLTDVLFCSNDSSSAVPGHHPVCPSQPSVLLRLLTGPQGPEGWNSESGCSSTKSDTEFPGSRNRISIQTPTCGEARQVLWSQCGRCSSLFVHCQWLPHMPHLSCGLNVRRIICSTPLYNSLCFS